MTVGIPFPYDMGLIRPVTTWRAVEDGSPGYILLFLHRWGDSL